MPTSAGSASPELASLERINGFHTREIQLHKCSFISESVDGEVRTALDSQWSRSLLFEGHLTMSVDKQKLWVCVWLEQRTVQLIVRNATPNQSNPRQLQCHLRFSDLWRWLSQTQSGLLCRSPCWKQKPQGCAASLYPYSQAGRKGAVPTTKAQTLQTYESCVHIRSGCQKQPGKQLWTHKSNYDRIYTFASCTGLRKFCAAPTRWTHACCGDRWNSSRGSPSLFTKAFCRFEVDRLTPLTVWWK